MVREIGIQALIHIPIAIAMLMYAMYCFINQGTHHRGKGWKTVEEAPKSFYFTVGFYVIMGLGILGWHGYIIVQKYILD